MIPFSTVDPLLSVDREPYVAACLFPSVNTCHDGTDLKAVLMLKVRFVLAKALHNPACHKEAVHSSSLAEAGQGSL